MTEFDPETGITTDDVVGDERYSIESFTHANQVDGNVVD
jgi:hypothetical protein